MSIVPQRRRIAAAAIAALLSTTHLSATAHFTPVPGQLEVGSFTLTADNGDTVTGTYETTGTVDAGGFAHFEGPCVITGGTGRFANATGSGTVSAGGRLAPPFEVQGSLTGTIDRHGS